MELKKQESTQYPIALLGSGQRLVATSQEVPIAKEERRRGSAGGRRAASPRRKQLVFFIIDDSSSMYGIKAELATEGVREGIYELKFKSPEDSAFDVVVFGYSDEIIEDPRHILVPVQDVNEDEICFYGDSGGTRIRMALEYAKSLLERHDRDYYRGHGDSQRVPTPLLVLLSDGKNGDGNPQHVANAIKEMNLAIGAQPLIATFGVEHDGESPDVDLLSGVASKTSDGMPLYYHISDISKLRALIATVSSSAATTADAVYSVARPMNPDNH